MIYIPIASGYELPGTWTTTAMTISRLTAMRRFDRLGALCGVIIIGGLAALTWGWRTGVGAHQSRGVNDMTDEVCLDDLFQSYQRSMDTWNERDAPASTDAMWRKLLDCEASIKQQSGRFSW